MTAPANELNRFLAAVKPSATSKVMDRVAARVRHRSLAANRCQSHAALLSLIWSGRASKAPAALFLLYRYELQSQQVGGIYPTALNDLDKLLSGPNMGRVAVEALVPDHGWRQRRHL
jgi:hypothetical protein